VLLCLFEPLPAVECGDGYMRAKLAVQLATCIPYHTVHQARSQPYEGGRWVQGHHVPHPYPMIQHVHSLMQYPPTSLDILPRNFCSAVSFGKGCLSLCLVEVRCGEGRGDWELGEEAKTRGESSTMSITLLEHGNEPSLKERFQRQCVVPLLVLNYLLVQVSKPMYSVEQ
jgi:hypothetical protein